MTALAKTWRALCHGPGCRRQQHRSPACLSSGAHHNAQPDKLQHRRITVVSGRAGAAVSSVVVDVEVVLSEEQQRQQLQQPLFAVMLLWLGRTKALTALHFQYVLPPVPYRAWQTLPASRSEASSDIALKTTQLRHPYNKEPPK